MPSRIRTLSIPATRGATIDAQLDLPTEEPAAWALLAHCFACSKDSTALYGITQALTRHGWAVLRLDFARPEFSSSVADVLDAVDHLRPELGPPSLLFGHSLGGPAVIRAAERIPDARLISTLNAPFDPSDLERLLGDAPERARREGTAEVRLGQRTIRLDRAFFEDLEAQPMRQALGDLRRPLLVFHSPQDQLVPIEQARLILDAASHPKSFIAVDGADHLVSRREDGQYVGDVLGVWAKRYLPETDRPTESLPEVGTVEVSETGEGTFPQRIRIGRHQLRADEPLSAGGTDTGPSPYDLLLAALGACTSMTLRLYAQRKGFPLEHVSVRLRHNKVHAQDCADCETKVGKIDVIDRELFVRGPLDEEQRSRLLEIADRCPVSRTLESEVKVRTRIA
jgi:putative redox protein